MYISAKKQIFAIPNPPGGRVNFIQIFFAENSMKCSHLKGKLLIFKSPTLQGGQGAKSLKNLGLL